MGYLIYQRDTAFRIDHQKKREALRAVKALFSAARLARDGLHDSTGYHYSWVDTAHALQSLSLLTMLEAWGWNARYDADGNIIHVEFDGEKAGDEDALFGALAPFVEAGSYIAMVGEDGDHWRWYFDGDRCHYQEARIVYDDGTTPSVEAGGVR